MVASGAVRNALDLKKEDAKVRDRYKGVEQFLTARRLVEAGVGCVTLSIGGWDTHGQNFQTLKRQLPQVDRGIANLIQDLHDRGMDDDVVTVMWGEFGRTPKINSNAGRDHWSPVMSRHDRRRRPEDGPGDRHARTARGERPKDRRTPSSQVLSTIYQRDGHRPGDDVPERQRPADVHPRRPRAGPRTAVRQSHQTALSRKRLSASRLFQYTSSSEGEYSCDSSLALCFSRIAEQRRRNRPASPPPPTSRTASLPHQPHDQGRRRFAATHYLRAARQWPAARPDRRCEVQVADDKIAEVQTSGRVIPLANGSTTITATFAGKTVSIPVKVELVGENLPINFANQIVPIFTKLGCNSGGCHGKASGQNGFKLSLLGFEPEVDYMTLVKEARGRRALPRRRRTTACCCRRRPARSPHGGGKKHGAGLRRVQARPPLDRLRHALRQARRSECHEDHRLRRTTAS